MARKTYFRYKPASRMHGPYPLTSTNCRKLPDMPGVYLLADIDAADKDAIVKYVGRAKDLSTRLPSHVGKTSLFYFRTVDTDDDAFYAECREFHRYGKVPHLRNRKHPERPAGSLLKRCSELGCRGEPD